MTKRLRLHSRTAEYGGGQQVSCATHLRPLCCWRAPARSGQCKGSWLQASHGCQSATLDNPPILCSACVMQVEPGKKQCICAHDAGHASVCLAAGIRHHCFWTFHYR